MSSEPLLSQPDRAEAATDVSGVESLMAPNQEPSLPRPAAEKRSFFSGFAASNLVWLLGPWVIGLFLGLVVPRRSTLPPPIADISAILGWVYFAAWSISFYPQLYTNYRRKSVVGLSLDFQLLNILGFACYAIYNSALYWNPAVRRQYAALHDGQAPAVHSNDVFFALHAFVATAVTLVQCIIYERNGARPARISIIAVVLTTVVSFVWAAVIVVFPAVDPDPCSRQACPPESMLTWLTFLYFLSMVKLAVTLIKYVPQIVLNCNRRSTMGWNVWNVLLDFEGGILSLAQQLMDAAACDRWTPITGNPVKFALGSVSMLFDLVFMVQHFCLFPDSKRQYAEQIMERDLERASLVVNGSNKEEDDDDLNAEPQETDGLVRKSSVMETAKVSNYGRLY